MTKDEIIEMGIKANLCDEYGTINLEYGYLNEIVAFATQVAAKEREIWGRRVARLQNLMDLREQQPNKPCCIAEREACAKLCEETDDGTPYNLAEECARNIRARGQA